MVTVRPSAYLNPDTANVVVIVQVVLVYLQFRYHTNDLVSADYDVPAATAELSARSSATGTARTPGPTAFGRAARRGATRRAPRPPPDSLRGRLQRFEEKAHDFSRGRMSKRLRDRYTGDGLIGRSVPAVNPCETAFGVIVQAVRLRPWVGLNDG